MTEKLNLIPQSVINSFHTCAQYILLYPKKIWLVHLFNITYHLFNITSFLKLTYLLFTCY